jgi:hypothetical protein
MSLQDHQTDQVRNHLSSVEACCPVCRGTDLEPADLVAGVPIHGGQWDLV